MPPGATILPYKGTWPRIDPSVFLAAGARIIGDVTIGAESSIWFNAVVRGDVHHVLIGRRTNIQDNTVLHETLELYPTELGDEVTVGHSAVLHACIVEDLCLIGMGAILLDGVVIGRGSLVAAGTLVSPGTKIPPGSLVVGVPGRVRRSLTAEETASLSASAQHYVEYAASYR
ncbi:MAG: gamma carbonic anhydrase family protein [Candidatus Riflebacteria bacterium]|nr:gamma carbonic anhydrase family protein [Candidatus Riflebacteria bacterium]